MTDKDSMSSLDFVPHRPARPIKFVKDKDGDGWLCDTNVDVNKDLKDQGCWRCEEMAFPDGGR